MNDGRGSVAAGMAICWLLNIAQLGTGWLLLVASVRMLPVYSVLIGAIGVVQVAYVVPIWRLLRRKGKPRTGKGVLLAAMLTALLNVVIAWMIYTSTRFCTVSPNRFFAPVGSRKAYLIDVLAVTFAASTGARP